MKPSIRNEIPPFGFAIVDKHGAYARDLYVGDDALRLARNDCGKLDWQYSKDTPHRIVELYTKEQLEKELEILRSKAFASGREILRLREKFEAVHGIVQPNSLEPAKGDL